MNKKSNKVYIVSVSDETLEQRAKIIAFVKSINPKYGNKINIDVGYDAKCPTIWTTGKIIMQKYILKFIQDLSEDTKMKYDFWVKEME